MEKFDPFDKKYKSVEDLPAEQQGNYTNVPDGGFVEKSAADRFTQAQEVAEAIDSHRSWVDKIRGKNKMDPMSILEDEALADNAVWDDVARRKNIQETDPAKVVSHNLAILESEMGALWKEQRRFDAPLLIADEEYMATAINGFIRPETGQFVVLGNAQDIPGGLKVGTISFSFLLGIQPLDKTSPSPHMQIKGYNAVGLSSQAIKNIKATFDEWNAVQN